MNPRHSLLLPAAALAAALLLPAPVVRAHCDSVDGPVVADAKAALAKGDVAPVLKWISAKQEADVRAAFARSPADGRAYVAAYVDLMHYTEAVVEAVHAEGGHAAHGEGAAVHGAEAKAAGHVHD